MKRGKFFLSLNSRLIFSFCWCCLVIILLLPSAFANVFNLTMTVEGVTKQFGYSKFEDVLSAVKLNQISNNFPGYSGTGSVGINLDFRGLPMSLSYASGSTDLVLSVPLMGINKTFSGTSRDATNDQFKDWLKKDGQATLNDILKKMAELSPYDPVAGNPTSLMGGMVTADFNRGFNPSSSTTTAGGAKDTSNLFGIGLQYGLYKASGLNASNYTLPLSYTIRFASDPRKQLIFDIPLNYLKVEDAKSYNVGISASFKFPVIDNWILTPSMGTGVAGSVDMASVGQIVSGSMTSSYTWDLQKVHLNLGNMLGYYQTIKIKIAGYESNPKLSNTVFRNGFMVSIPHKISTWDSESEIFVVDTRFFGDKLYLEQYNEFGFSLGSVKSRADLIRYLRGGFTYLFSSKTKGYVFNVGYSF
ncbi:MAG: hypothetical protein HQK49_17855 [Oligoflexia bacterium]|nr:hypothetical protein [Oligoflexia bacterium]